MKCTSVLLQCRFPQFSGYHCIENAPLVTKNFGLFEVAGITTWLWYVKLYIKKPKLKDLTVIRKV